MATIAYYKLFDGINTWETYYFRTSADAVGETDNRKFVTAAQKTTLSTIAGLTTVGLLKKTSNGWTIDNNTYATQSWVEGKGYTTNTGTVTSVAVKMNGSTKGTVTSSGTIDLGTVITAHQDISGKQDKSTLETDVAAKGFTKNAGTVTGVKINNVTKTPTSGVVDLGTVITAHQSLAGYATETWVTGKGYLDSNSSLNAGKLSGKISTDNLPDSILGQLIYKATWNAQTGSQISGLTKGWYYICTTAGSKNPDGTTTSGRSYDVGDWAIYNGSGWDKVDNTDAISSWCGLTGAITADQAKTQLGLQGAAYKAENYYTVANNAISGATKCKITYDAKGLVTKGENLAASDIPDLSATYVNKTSAQTITGNKTFSTGKLYFGSNNGADFQMYHVSGTMNLVAGLDHLNINTDQGDLNLESSKGQINIRTQDDSIGFDSGNKIALLASNDITFQCGNEISFKSETTFNDVVYMNQVLQVSSSYGIDIKDSGQIYGDGDDYITIAAHKLCLAYDKTDYYVALGTDYLEANRIIQFPDKSGTIALTDDLPTVTKAATAPSNPKKGDIWFDTSTPSA